MIVQYVTEKKIFTSIHVMCFYIIIMFVDVQVFLNKINKFILPTENLKPNYTVHV